MAGITSVNTKPILVFQNNPNYGMLQSPNSGYIGVLYLLDKGLFLSAPSDCYYQIAGVIGTTIFFDVFKIQDNDRQVLCCDLKLGETVTSSVLLQVYPFTKEHNQNKNINFGDITAEQLSLYRQQHYHLEQSIYQQHLWLFEAQRQEFLESEQQRRLAQLQRLTFNQAKKLRAKEDALKIEQQKVIQAEQAAAVAQAALLDNQNN